MVEQPGLLFAALVIGGWIGGKVGYRHGFYGGVRQTLTNIIQYFRHKIPTHNDWDEVQVDLQIYSRSRDTSGDSVCW